MARVSTRETRAARGRRRGQQLAGRLLDELRVTRTTADLSQNAVADALGWSQPSYWRFENGRSVTSMIDISAAASVLGLELGAGLHLYGEPIRNKGHQALIARFRAQLSPAFKVLAEAPLPLPGDPRSWDLLLRIVGQVIGVEAETRVRDIQRLTRHVHQRERDGGVDEIVLLLAASQTNRALLGELLSSLGPRYATPPHALLTALRAVQPLPGSGVLLL